MNQTPPDRVPCTTVAKEMQDQLIQQVLVPAFSKVLERALKEPRPKVADMDADALAHERVWRSGRKEEWLKLEINHILKAQTK